MKTSKRQADHWTSWKYSRNAKLHFLMEFNIFIFNFQPCFHRNPWSEAPSIWPLRVPRTNPSSLWQSLSSTRSSHPTGPLWVLEIWYSTWCLVQCAIKSFNMELIAIVKTWNVQWLQINVCLWRGKKQVERVWMQFELRRNAAQYRLLHSSHHAWI